MKGCLYLFLYHKRRTNVIIIYLSVCYPEFWNQMQWLFKWFVFSVHLGGRRGTVAWVVIVWIISSLLSQRRLEFIVLFKTLYWPSSIFWLSTVGKSVQTSASIWIYSYCLLTTSHNTCIYLIQLCWVFFCMEWILPSFHIWDVVPSSSRRCCCFFFHSSPFRRQWWVSVLFWKFCKRQTEVALKLGVSYHDVTSHNTFICDLIRLCWVLFFAWNESYLLSVFGT